HDAAPGSCADDLLDRNERAEGALADGARGRVSQTERVEIDLPLPLPTPRAHACALEVCDLDDARVRRRAARRDPRCTSARLPRLADLRQADLAGEAEGVRHPI